MDFSITAAADSLANIEKVLEKAAIPAAADVEEREICIEHALFTEFPAKRVNRAFSTGSRDGDGILSQK